MMTDYDKGVAILRLIRSGDKDWVSKVLRVREGHSVPSQFTEISWKAVPYEAISEEDAARALEWASAIWLSEKSGADELLVEIVAQRNKSVAEAEDEFRRRIKELYGSEPTPALVDDILAKHSVRMAECAERRNLLAPSWREINRERLLAQSAELRRAQGGTPPRSTAQSIAEEQERYRIMTLIQAWIEREEGRHGDRET